MTAEPIPEVFTGEVMPRVMTPPLITGPPGPCGCGCALTRDTSYGFDVDRWARDTLRMPLTPWQRVAAIHGGELLPDGRPRFRRLIIVVARQNGKTHLLVVLALYWLFMDVDVDTILGTSTQIKYAGEPWTKAHALALANEELEPELPPGKTRGKRTKNGDERWRTLDGSQYVITPSNEEGGRSLTLDRVVADELSRQFTYGAYNAAYYAMRARPGAQYWGLTTPLDARSVPFNSFESAATRFIETGDGDYRLGLFSWSAPPDASPLDPRALAAANPNAGIIYPFEDLLNEAKAAVSEGGDMLVGFKTEAMCITAISTNAAINADAWEACKTLADVDFTDLRGLVALCFDVAPSMQHATLYAAAEQPDGRVRIGPVQEWSGPGCADRAGRELPALVARVRPRVVGVLPSGPGAAVMSGLAKNRPNVWPPRGVAVEEIRGELTATAMGFAALVDAVNVARAPEPLLDGQVAVAEKLARGDAWVFSRRGEGDCDALYAAAGAAHLARSLPPAGEVRYLRPRPRTP